MKIFLMVGNDEIEFYINDGWEIVSSAPNPHPQPYIYFCIRKESTQRLTARMKEELQIRCSAYRRGN